MPVLKEQTSQGRQTGNRCPRCAFALETRCDMWGPYWECEACGYAAEDVEEVRALVVAAARPLAIVSSRRN